MAQVTYEFLARWDIATGLLKGAHCKNYDIATGREGDAQSVAVAGNAGFPLADILTSLQSGAIIAMDTANAALTAERLAHSATSSLLANAVAKLTAAGIP